MGALAALRGTRHLEGLMSDFQAIYDDAMFDYSTGDYDTAIAKLAGILAEDPQHFDAQLSIAMCHYRKGDYATAIAEGHKAQTLKPNEQLVHTNLSLFYMKSGDKKTAEYHGLQARIASWKENMAPPPAGQSAVTESAEDDLKMAQPKAQAFKLPEKFPEQPWKKNKAAGAPPPAH
jgi:predicted Zn-dependent protease